MRTGRRHWDTRQLIPVGLHDRGSRFGRASTVILLYLLLYLLLYRSADMFVVQTVGFTHVGTRRVWASFGARDAIAGKLGGPIGDEMNRERGTAVTKMVPTVEFNTEARLEMPDATEEVTVGLQLRCMLPARDGEVLGPIT
jgi:hypothetical protein